MCIARRHSASNTSRRSLLARQPMCLPPRPLLPHIHLLLLASSVPTQQTQSPLDAPHIRPCEPVFIPESLTLARAYSELSPDQLRPRLRAERLGSLDGRAHRTINDQLRQHTERAAHTEQNGVEVLLRETVVLQQNTAVRIHVRVRVLRLAVLGQDTGRDLVHLADELEHGVVGQVLEGELALGDVARVRLAEHSVAVAGDHTAGLEGVPQVFLDVLVAQVRADGFLHLLQPVQHFLVGEAVEGPGETVQAGGEGEVGGGEGRADEVGGVGRDVAAFVVGVDGQVQTHELDEVGVVGETELVCEVVAVVLVLLHRRDLAVLVDIAVDARGDRRQLGNEIHAVLESVLPVLRLLHALGIVLRERTLMLKRGHSQRELRHGVQIARTAVDELIDEVGHIAARGPLCAEIPDLLLRGYLASQQQPEETLGERLLAAGSLREQLLALGDGLAAETDTLLTVEDRALPDQRFDAAGAAVDLIEGDFADDLVAVVFAEGLDLVDLLGEGGGEGLLQGLMEAYQYSCDTVAKGMASSPRSCWAWHMCVRQQRQTSGPS